MQAVNTQIHCVDDKNVSFTTLYDSCKLVHTGGAHTNDMMHIAVSQHEVKFPPTITSSICAVDGHKTYQHHLFIEVYGNYVAAYTEVSLEVDAMLLKGAHYEEDDHYSLLTLFCSEMTKLNLNSQEVEESIRKMKLKGRAFTKEIFHYLATSILIMPKLALVDKQGTTIHKAMIKLKKTYCKMLDKDITTKAEIYALLRLPLKSLQQLPTASLVEDIVMWPTYPPTHSTLAGLPNYTKSPIIHIGLIEAALNGQNKPGILLKEKERAIFTRVFDFFHEPTSYDAITTEEQFNRLVYRSGDSRDGVQAPFQLQQRVSLTSPCVYWSAEKKKAMFRLKAVELRVFDKRATQQISDEEMSLRAERALQKKESYAISSQLSKELDEIRLEELRGQGKETMVYSAISCAVLFSAYALYALVF